MDPSKRLWSLIPVAKLIGVPEIGPFGRHLSVGREFCPLVDPPSHTILKPPPSLTQLPTGFMAQSSPGSAARPLSPHIGVWRWHVTMVCSIATRATGIALYVGFLLLAGWAMALAAGADAYGGYMRLVGSIPGKVVIFGFTVSALYHLAAGIRHLVWDSGWGFLPKTANATAWAALIFGFVGAVVVFVIAHLMGAL